MQRFEPRTTLFSLAGRWATPVLRGVFPLFLLLGVAPATSAQQAAESSALPHLARNGEMTQLMVHGAPFVILGGELRNSSSSSLAYMGDIWSRLERMNLNTVLAVVSWAQVEPVEGSFDFSLVDGLIAEARNHQLKLVLLWFGSWKNGLSHYAPAWVKEDFRRFPRVQLATGPTEVLSPLNDANRDADTRAFAAFMRHLREVDSAEHTVIMVQVENEVGLLGDARDRSGPANAAFGRPVPRELLDHLARNRERLSPELRATWDGAGARRAGSWGEVFGAGPAADEIFMAWHYARYVQRMAEAGKAEYPLPLFVNAWIVQPQDRQPGDYPSGGPQAHVHEVWKAAAPAIDILAPDIYLPGFPEIVAQYQRSGTPLFIPESRAGAQGAANAFYAIGARGAIGYSPFGIETSEPDPGRGPLSLAYGVLAQLAPLIAEHQAAGTIAGIWLNAERTEERIRLGDYWLTATLGRGRGSPATPTFGYGLVMALGANEFLVAGADIQVTFAPATEGPPVVGLATVDEGTFVDGRWVAGRRLNGDEIMSSYEMARMATERQTGTALRLPSEPGILRARVYRFE